MKISLSQELVLVVKYWPSIAGDVRVADGSLDWKDPLEEGMANNSSILAWRIPWTDIPGRL